MIAGSGDEMRDYRPKGWRMLLDRLAVLAFIVCLLGFVAAPYIARFIH